VPVCVWWLVCGRAVLGGKAGASVYEWCWCVVERSWVAGASVYEWCWCVVERSWVVRPVPVCVVLVCGRAVLGGKAGASVCGGWCVVERPGEVDVSVCVVVGMW